MESEKKKGKMKERYFDSSNFLLHGEIDMTSM